MKDRKKTSHNHSLLSESFGRMAQPCGLQTMLYLQMI
nr:MAG TPA: hypothetical protein [Caudoviricetes sp.]